VSQEHGYHTKDPKVSNAGAVRVKSRERRSMATEDSIRRRAHCTTEGGTNLTQVQGPRGEVKLLRPAFLYYTAKSREATRSWLQALATWR
jgi:hypothetical protein